MKKKIMLKPLFLTLLFVSIAGCSSYLQPVNSAKATVNYRSQISSLLRSLPTPKKPIVVAIYKFKDLTGQYKSSDTLSLYSTAVTQGSTSMLIRALMEAGNGKWFTVLEREGLSDLLNERKIINQTREAFLPADPGKSANKPSNLPPMLYAPVLLEGGIVAYEANALTGGAGAKYFGIGGSTEFRRDTVTSMLRAVSVKNGEIITHVDSRKTILSLALDSGLYRYVSYLHLLEMQAGVTSNEPPQMAVLESVEACVYAMIVEGLIKNVWSLEDPKLTKGLIDNYLHQLEPNEQHNTNDLQAKKEGNVDNKLQAEVN